MSRFNESRSRLARVMARNEGNLFRGVALEALGLLWLKPGIRRWVRHFTTVRTPEKWLFVVGCYNSGTSILRRLLESHPEISATVREGAKLTDAFPSLEAGGWPRMMYRNRHLWGMVGDDSGHLADRARHDCSIWFRKGARVFMEKSVDHSTRIRWLNTHFANAHFIRIVRNGFCVNEGIMRRARPYGPARQEVGAHYPPWLVARQWVAIDDHVSSELDGVERKMTIRYEDLMTDPVGAMTAMFAFLGLDQPEMHMDGDTIVIDRQRHQLVNQNPSAMARLSVEEKAAMWPIMADAMVRNGYPFD